jgi:trans-aconitate methyltransferase
MDATLDRAADERMADYLRFHAPRFAYLLDLLAGYVTPASRVLDIGMSRLTGTIHERFGAAVDALGFDADGPIPSGHYYQFDLNDCQRRDSYRDDLPGYDVIVFAEVIEHLYTAPSLVLRFLAEHLNPGGVLIVQTPNGVTLPRRVKMLLGRNPYELIREDATNPGHFREYTASELKTYLAVAGLDCERVEHRSYFDYRYCHHGERRPGDRFNGAVKNWFYPLLPPTWRPGLTVVGRKRGFNSTSPRRSGPS